MNRRANYFKRVFGLRIATFFILKVFARVFYHLLLYFDEACRLCQGNFLHVAEFTRDDPGANLSFIDSIAGLLQLLFGSRKNVAEFSEFVFDDTQQLPDLA